MNVDLVLASHNAGKVRELRRLLADLPIVVRSLADLSHRDELREDGATLEANALQKVEQAVALTGLVCLADDSGLEVDALDGAPGVYSARYSGEPRDDARNNDALLHALRDVPEPRAARFRCVVAIADPTGALARDPMIFEGSCPGRIVTAPRGSDGFGYDPLFVPDGFDLTFAELGAATKDALSHRGRAMSAVRDWLASRTRSR